MPPPRSLRVALLQQQAEAASAMPQVEEESDTLSELPSHRGALPMVPPAVAPAAFGPLSADDCFAMALELDIPCHAGTPDKATVRAYYTPPKGGLSNEATVFVCHHGAGFGSLSYALTARALSQQTQGAVGILAYDCRGHGRSKFPPEAVGDMSLAALTGDLVQVIHTLFPRAEERPSLILVGHSMGGAVVVEAAHTLENDPQVHILGVVMIDIVEGTSLRLLPHMKQIVQQRPEGFVSLESAIQWHIKSRTIRNPMSARRSVPSLVHEARGYTTLPWRWNADLLATEPFWHGWFNGLSNKFLCCRAARLLLLAETDNLDPPLMIGQMQGKYQLVVSPHAGHCVQEDMPQHTAETLAHFWERNDRLPPGVQPVGASS
ncbi:protein phosphatase methylesterase-1 [Malassezia nana]|uniref:Protein phosphatase methylesterase 1 n=1 Tax=Malassezia nana TaxID=180528 RepID=A0AAF0J411_9BASI|nr:protein phosphatase methylesterase-1 [Malassezia nana]